MPKPSESGTRVQGTPTTSYTRLTKAELVAIINGNVKSTLDALHHIYKNL